MRNAWLDLYYVLVYSVTDISVCFFHIHVATILSRFHELFVFYVPVDMRKYD